jgi:hypothetical protein
VIRTLDIRNLSGLRHLHSAEFPSTMTASGGGAR